jgi:SAM-dependent methyltransferase
VEPSLNACQNAKKLGVKNIICASINDEDFNDNSFGNCLLLDVIEHIADDEAFLKVLNKKMRKGAKLIISVPAFQCLMSSHDKAVGHFRRYSLKDLKLKLAQSGFLEIGGGYFFSYLFFAVLIFRAAFEKVGFIKAEKSTTNRGHFNNKIIVWCLSLIGKIETWLLLKNVKIPFGSSLVVIARKN